MADSREAEYRLVAAQGGTRLDLFVASEVPSLSRTAVQRLIDAGHVTVNGTLVQASYRVREGDAIAVVVPSPTPVTLVAEALPLDVLYEDSDILVVNKAAGMVVHPGAGRRSGTLVNAVLAHSPDLAGVGGELRPGIVHRLDRDTSGVLVVAKHDAALRALQSQFKRRTVEKRYTALTQGTFAQDDGLVEAPIARDRRNRKRMAVRGDGKMARTRWHVLGRYRDVRGRLYTLLDVLLLTGRTHQIRVHMAWMGYPLVGDRTYGPTSAGDAVVERTFLHARELTLVHTSTGDVMHFTAPLPNDLQNALLQLKPVDL